MKTALDVNQAVRGMAQLYQHDGDGEMIAFYTQILLLKLSAVEACRAIAQWGATEARWPAPAQIIQLLKPMLKPMLKAKDAAGDLSQTLLTLISRRGYTWESTYRYEYPTLEEAIEREAGLEALAVVARCGGWANFCREWGGEQGDGTARAQLRGLCESAIIRAPTSAASLIAASSEKPKDAIGDYITKQKVIRARDPIAEQFTAKMQEQLARIGNK